MLIIYLCVQEIKSDSDESSEDGVWDAIDRMEEEQVEPCVKQVKQVMPTFNKKMLSMTMIEAPEFINFIAAHQELAPSAVVKVLKEIIETYGENFGLGQPYTRLDKLAGCVAGDDQEPAKIDIKMKKMGDKLKCAFFGDGKFEVEELLEEWEAYLVDVDEFKKARGESDQLGAFDNEVQEVLNSNFGDLAQRGRRLIRVARTNASEGVKVRLFVCLFVFFSNVFFFFR